MIASGQLFTSSTPSHSSNHFLQRLRRPVRLSFFFKVRDPRNKYPGQISPPCLKSIRDMLSGGVKRERDRYRESLDHAFQPLCINYALDPKTDPQCVITPTSSSSSSSSFLFFLFLVLSFSFPSEQEGRVCVCVYMPCSVRSLWRARASIPPLIEREREREIRNT